MYYIGKYTILALVHESYIPRFTVFAPGFVEGLVVKVLDWKLFSPGTIDSFNRPPRCQFRTININFLSFHECRRPKDPEGARIMLTSWCDKFGSWWVWKVWIDKKCVPNYPLNDWTGMMISPKNVLWGVQIRKKRGSVAATATTLPPPPPPPTTVSSVELNSPSFLGPFIQQKLMLIKKRSFLSNSDYINYTCLYKKK